MLSASYSCHILMNFEFYQQNLEKYSNKKVMKIRPVGFELFHADGWWGRRDEANSHFSQFCYYT